MRLTYTCSSCKKTNYFKPIMNSRAQLQMKFGDTVRVSCNNCGKDEKKHLNKIRAVVDNRLVIGGLIVGVLIVLFLVNYVIISWKILAIGGSTIAGIPVFFWNLENKAVGNFNRYAIKR